MVKSRKKILIGLLRYDGYEYIIITEKGEVFTTQNKVIFDNEMKKGYIES